MEPEQSSKPWIALYTKSRSEKSVAGQLEQLGIESYVPLRRELHYWSDRRKWIEAPLIPSYVFAHVDDKDYYRMFSCNGIVRVVMFNNRIARIQENEIQLLKRATKCEKVIAVPSSEINVQDEVEITGGPFAGYRGKVAVTGNKCKVGIRIEELEYSVVVEIPKTDVRVLATKEEVI